MEQNLTQSEGKAPYFSIILPTYNAEKTLETCLKALLDSSFRDFELIVVDDGSQDRSLSIVRSFPCKVLEMDYNRGAAAARNQGAKKARGEILLFIDTDVVVQPDTLSLFRESLQQYPAVFGIYHQKSGVDNILSLYQNFYAHKSIEDTRELTTMFYTYCAAVRKDIFLTAGGFDENWTRATFEDVEFGLRISEAGHQILLNKNIKVTHYNDFTFRRFINNYYFKSRELSKLMFAQQKLTLGDEGWTNRKNMFSFLAGLAIIPAFLASLIFHYIAFIFLATTIIFLFFNYDFYVFILKNKPKRILAALLLNLLVQIISACGMFVGITHFLRKKII